MLITYSSDDRRFIANCTFDERTMLKEAGFRWNGRIRRWWTDRPDVARRLSEHTDSYAKKAIEEATVQHNEAIEASRAVSAAISVPAPADLSYLPFQLAGIAYAMQHHSCLIADEMGLGKTIQSIGLINASTEIHRVLIICPASLRLNWKHEVEKWLVRPLRVEITGNSLPDADIVIVNYDIIGKHRAALEQRPWDLLICDEAHYLKNPKARRTIAVLGCRGLSPIPAKRRIFLTGTPILNRPIELLPILQSMGMFKSWFEYTQRYCSAYRTHWGWDVSGASNLHELQDILRSKCMVRRLKKDVLSELPAKRRAIVELTPNRAAKTAIRGELDAFARHEKALIRLQVDVEIAKAGSSVEYEEAVQRLRDASNTAFAEISSLRHATALAKVEQVIEFAREVLEGSDQKLVIFAHHHDVISALIEGLSMYSPVKLTGEMGPADRQSSVDRFQSDEAVRVFIGSIQAAGVGLTLTASSHVIFAELDWVPGNITQAEDRLHRIGQTQSVIVQHLVLDGSLDARMAKCLVDKQETIDRALDREETAIETTIPTLAEPSQTVTAKEIEKEAESMGAPQIGTVHAQLRFLAGLDEDRARELNSLGFNRFDSALGHRLAELEHLTPKQAALGRKMLRKYHRQLEQWGVMIQ